MSASQRKIHAAELRQLRAGLGLNQEEMGKLLGVTREWIGKLEREKEDFSEFLLMKMEAARSTGSAGEQSSQSARRVYLPVAGGYGPLQQAAELRDTLEKLIIRADLDPNRLGWLLEQMRAHLVAPSEHWKASQAPSHSAPGQPKTVTAEHEAAIRRETFYEHIRDAAGAAKRDQDERSSKKTHAGAGR